MAKLTLSDHPLFSKISREDQDRFLANGIEKTYPKDQWITHYGSDWPYLFMVEKGQVTALKESAEGRSLVVITLEEGTEMVMPGDNTVMEIKLITPIAMEEQLRFAIREGGRTIGAGVVTKIFE